MNTRILVKRGHIEQHGKHDHRVTKMEPVRAYQAHHFAGGGVDGPGDTDQGYDKRDAFLSTCFSVSARLGEMTAVLIVYMSY